MMVDETHGPYLTFSAAEFTFIIKSHVYKSSNFYMLRIFIGILCTHNDLYVTT